jgi:hypothetical protein
VGVPASADPARAADGAAEVAANEILIRIARSHPHPLRSGVTIRAVTRLVSHFFPWNASSVPRWRWYPMRTNQVLGIGQLPGLSKGANVIHI